MSYPDLSSMKGSGEALLSFRSWSKYCSKTPGSAVARGSIKMTKAAMWKKFLICILLLRETRTLCQLTKTKTLESLETTELAGTLDIKDIFNTFIGAIYALKEQDFEIVSQPNLIRYVL